MSELAIVFERDGRPLTTSRNVAEHFGKQHKNVIRDIQNIVCDVGDDFNRLNFELVDYRDAKGESRPEYLITKDGFTLLAMGYTGAKAMQFKVAYINAFNKMEAALQERAALPPPPTALEAKLDVLISLMAHQYAPQMQQPMGAAHTPQEPPKAQGNPEGASVLPGMEGHTQEPPQMQGKLAYSVPEMAAALGVGRNVAYVLVQRADFPAIRIGERRVVVPIEGLNTWLKKQAHREDVSGIRSNRRVN